MSQVFMFEAAAVAQVTVVTLAALGLMGVFHRQAAMRHAIGASGLLLVLASPLLALAWPRPFWLPIASAAASDHASALEGPHDTAIIALSEENAAVQAASASADVIVPMAPPERTSSGGDFDAAAEVAATPVWEHFASDWRTLALAIGNLAWLAGMLFFASRHMRSLAVLNYLRRSLEAWPSRPAFRDEPEICRDLGLERLPPIMLSDLAPTPLVLGTLKPIVVLPRALAELAADGSAGLANSVAAEKLRTIVIHEAAHIARRDPWILAAQLAAQTVFWSHPGVSQLNRQINRSREELCDNHVLRRSDAAGYAEMLLELALRGLAPAALGLFSTRWSLEQRISGLLSPHRDTATGARRGRAPACVFLLLALSAIVGGVGAFSTLSSEAAPPESRSQSNERPARGISNLGDPQRATEGTIADGDGAQATASTSSADPNGRSQDESVVVLCFDNEGNPVVGAEVHLFQCISGKAGRYKYFGPFTSDEQGRAACPRAIVYFDDPGRFDRWAYARVPGRLVGVARSANWKNRSPVNPEFRVELQPSRSVEGTLTVPQGFKPSQVAIRIAVMHVKTGPGDFDFQSFPRYLPFAGLDTALPEIFDKQPDAEGRFRFNDIPVRGNLYLTTVGAGLAEAQWWNENKPFDAPIRLDVNKEGVLTGRVALPDGKPAAGMNIAARLSFDPQRRLSRLSTFNAVTDANGEFAIHGLPDASLVLSIEDPGLEWIVRPREGLLVAAGETKNVSVSMEEGVVVSGRVFDPDGRPVEGAAISALDDTQGAPGLAHDVSDREGRYRLRLPSGRAQLYFNSLPDGFVYPNPQIVKRLEIAAGQAPVEGLDFTISRAAKEDARSKPPSRKRGDTPVGNLLDTLVFQNAGDELFKDSWLRTLKEIVDLGPDAVPELIEELDATQDDKMLRCLGFTLRAIGDKRAVPALVRAIPKTLRPPGSDMGLRAEDVELLKFAQLYDLDPGDRDNHYGFGRPVREICSALEKTTGQNFGEEQLYNVFLDGLPSQRRMKRELFQRTAQAWADWWEKGGAVRIPDAAYARVNLPKLAEEVVAAPLPPGAHFKIVDAASGWVLESVLNPQAKIVFYDFDTGRTSAVPDRWRTAKDIEAHADEIVAWAQREGFDWLGTEYAPPNGGKRVFALRSIGLRAWELGKNRWKMQSNDVTLEALQAEGTPADGLLMHYDKQGEALDPKATATFLFITREGTPGLLFVGVEVQNDSLKPGGPTVGDTELQPIAFRKGRRFGFNNFEQVQPAERERR